VLQLGATPMLFQFHSGAIKSCREFCVFHHLLLFQFHSGAIKSVLSTTPPPSPSWFQFHSGAIKSPPGERRASRSKTFQFHSGAIKSHIAFQDFQIEVGFNSILVRLKALKFYEKFFHQIRVSIPFWCD